MLREVVEVIQFLSGWIFVELIIIVVIIAIIVISWITAVRYVGFEFFSPK